MENKPHIKRHRTGYWMIYVNRSAPVPLISDKCLQSAWEAYEHWFKVTMPSVLSNDLKCPFVLKSEPCGHVDNSKLCNKTLNNCKNAKKSRSSWWLFDE